MCVLHILVQYLLLLLSSPMCTMLHLFITFSTIIYQHSVSLCDCCYIPFFSLLSQFFLILLYFFPFLCLFICIFFIFWLVHIHSFVTCNMPLYCCRKLNFPEKSFRGIYKVLSNLIFYSDKRDQSYRHGFYCQIPEQDQPRLCQELVLKQSRPSPNQSNAKVMTRHPSIMYSPYFLRVVRERQTYCGGKLQNSQGKHSNYTQKGHIHP